MCSEFGSKGPIKPQFCTCHDSPAVLACAKLWLDWMYNFLMKTISTVSRLDNEFIPLSRSQTWGWLWPFAILYLSRGHPSYWTLGHSSQEATFHNLHLSARGNHLSSDTQHEQRSDGKLQDMDIIYTFFWLFVLISYHGKSFHATHCPFPREATGLRWIPPHRGSDAELWWCLCWWPKQAVEQNLELLVIWDTMTLMWRRCYVYVAWFWNPLKFGNG